MMKLFTTVFLLFCALAGAAGAQIEPLANKFEARIIAEAEAQPDAAKRAQILDEALSDERAGAALIFNAANAAMQNSGPEKAARLYAMALEKMPNFYMARRNLAYINFEAQDYKKALEGFASALALSSADAPKIYAAMGVCHANLKNFSEALTCFEQALVFSPSDISLMKNKAKCLSEIGLDYPLKELVLELLEKDCKDANLWRILARLHIKNSELKEAAAAIEAMRSLGLAQEMDYALLGDIYANLNMPIPAAEAYSRAALPPDKAYKIARFFADLGMPEEAEKTAKSLEKDSWEYFEIMGIIAEKRGGGALEFFEKSHAKNPSNPRVCLKLADIYLARKMFESARTFYAAAGELKEQSLAGLANAEIAEGNFSKAAEILERLRTQFNRGDLDEIILKLKEAQNGSKQ